ncbi:GNAT family N-acetyltransferase [Synechocystis sp. PCC 7509]|uniref:GNAT family N-acetyltransferase n=1 Tax=Synechocystis sp. PCC 7509 TaxID=927677 RepID=UPI0002ABFEEC|nr:N-acetyltransferase [Synechocystis sp. PCC 7509]
MLIRAEQLADYQEISDVILQAFGQDNEARLVQEIRKSTRYIPNLSLVAEVDGVIVGHILFSYIDLVDDVTCKVLGLAPLAVKSQFQKQGIGSALVRAGLIRADTMGESSAIALGNPQFYNRFGFKPSVCYQIESPFPVPEDFFMVKTLNNYRDQKGKVVYPPAFLGV